MWFLVFGLAWLLPMHSFAEKGFYDLTFTSLNGEEVAMETFRGKGVLIVNTASECGLTPQYGELQALYEAYDGELQVVGFPSNDFANQEPLDSEGIATFCEDNFGVTFTMAKKISVKGSDMHAVYEWLTNKSHNGFKDSEVQWNFQKYLISRSGELIQVFDPRTTPMSDEVTQKAESLLNIQ